MKLTFEGAAQTVTGSQTLVDHLGYSCLVDCGLYQGPKDLKYLNWEKPKYVDQVKAIILTHAHIDHSGLVPRWMHWGWEGPIFCTQATRDLLNILLLDAAKLQEEDAQFANKTKHSRHDPALPLYTEADAKKALEFLHVVPFNEWQELSSTMSFRLVRAGHILGSAMVQLAYTDNHNSSLLTFSGDLGGGHSDIIKDPVSLIETDTLVLESTYGDRKVNSDGREERLAAVVNKVFSRQGTLIIPAFALGRTQDLLFSLYRLKTQGAIPDVPIYLDSPMANSVTSVYQKYFSEMKLESTNTFIEGALSHKNFHKVESPDDSMLLCMSDEPKIVISASGMLQGGRVMHHLRQKLSDAKSGVLFVGFQGRETKGRLLQEGLMTLRIHHKEVPVEAEIFSIDGYSAHADAEDMVTWLKTFQKLPKTLFLNHGEAEGQIVFAERLRAEFGVNVVIPELHQEFLLQKTPIRE